MRVPRIKGIVRYIGAWCMVATLLLGPLSVPALGHAPPNFGSNWSHICDTTIASECKAPSAGLDIALYSLETKTSTATQAVISSQYQPTDLFFYYVTSNDDVGVFDGYYGTTGFAAAWTACAPGATYYGSEANHTRSCTPQDIRYNFSYASRWDENPVGESRWIACQEVGHTVGLRHNQGTTSTCMHDLPSTDVIIQHEKDHINANY